jgi:apolipoprotein N-acyltransferase
MFNAILKALLVIVLSGLGYYYSVDFHFQWWLMWLAPIPVLIYTYRVNFWCSLIVTFLVGLAPGINGIIGYHDLLSTELLLTGTLIQSVEWTIVVLISRAIVRRDPSWVSVFAFPVTQALFEWWQSLGSDGTFNTFSYSQLPMLPAVQIASLTGFMGVTFIVSLFGSAIAYGIVYRNNRREVLLASLVSVIVIIASLGYGFYRMNHVRNEPAAHVTVGLVSISAAPKMLYQSSFTEHFIQAYLPEIQHLAAQGAQVVLLPEESITVTPETRDAVMQQLSQIAGNNKIELIIGVNEHTATQRFNEAWYFNAQGAFVGEYRKRHFVPIVEDGITPGVALLNFPLANQKAGIAICRDMDYTNPAHQYGEDGTQLLFAPAWDFDKDAYVHNQGAWMRGIENGYTLVRSARGGLLSVTSASGEILGEASATGINKSATLLVNAPISTDNSVYATHRNWFVWVLGVLLILLLVHKNFLKRK